MLSAPFLIVGLGNPGKEYDGTRHNVGFAALDWLAEKYGLRFRKKGAWKGEIAEGNIGDRAVILLKPHTYMNVSGESVALVMRYLQIELSHLLVVVDDIAIPLGQLRIRSHSSSGGHNGLKSIEEHLQTQGYARLRIGIGDRSAGDLASHVLSPFRAEEKPLLPKILERAGEAIVRWLTQGLTSAMVGLNPPSNPSIGDNNDEEKKGLL